MSDKCIFCEIVEGKIPSFKIWEDKDYLAILDGFPNTKGQTLVMPKKHFDSYIFDMSSKMYLEFMSRAREVSKLLEKSLGVHRVALIMEGMGVNHAHLKLYPLHGIDEKFKEMWAKDKIYFDKYEGYLSTQLGPDPNRDELAKLAEKIRGKRK
ncbi:MAG: HIT domain-containing protein [Nanoarchaeota archaeon]